MPCPHSRNKPGAITPALLAPPPGGAWKRALLVVGAFLLLQGLLWAANAVERFPPPDFSEGYVRPEQAQPEGRETWKAWMDAGVLVAALLVCTWIVYKTRSRRAMVVMTIFSLLYFGFYRKGCVCPIGAIQNVTSSLFVPEYLLPGFVLLFFLLPLIFAVFVGRVFCAGVCPLGAVQDLVLVRPLRVPRVLDESLSVLRYVYLGFAVLFAALGARYIICVYDPFVGFFRLSARFHIWVISGIVLGTSMFIGRPYCRYLCPYGALLSLFSRFSARHVTITPDECVKCGLCAQACPFGAIREADTKREDV